MHCEGSLSCGQEKPRPRLSDVGAAPLLEKFLPDALSTKTQDLCQQPDEGIADNEDSLLLPWNKGQNEQHSVDCELPKVGHTLNVLIFYLSSDFKFWGF